MKNILMIAYYYPPKGGAGVQRTAKFAKYLCSFGYNVHVLTVKEKTRGVIDYSLESDIQEGITVHRTFIDESSFIDKLITFMNKGASRQSANSNLHETVKKYNKIKPYIRKLMKKVFLSIYNIIYIPDAQKGWIDYAVEEGKKIIRKNNIDIIYTTSSPYTSHLIGLKLSKDLNVKWIADFRDPWASNPFVDYYFIIQAINNNLESKVVKRADRIVSVSKPIIDDFIMRYPNEKEKKFVVIPNGYDEEDFKNLDLSLSNDNKKFKILYSGTLYGKRSPEKILSVIDKLIESNLINKDKIEIKFIGEIGSEFKNILNGFSNKFPDILKYTDYMPHSESLIELANANALLLIIDEGRGSEGIYTGKIFEYIRTGKPIIAIVPEGVARDLVLDTKTGYTAYPSKFSEIENIVYMAYSDFLGGNKNFNPGWDKIIEYSRENISKQLDNIICDVLRNS